MKLNLPNKLTVLRLILVPIFVVVMMLANSVWMELLGLILFVGASLTDMLDGKIARKYHLVTDFGKFLDPLADKFMVIGAMLVILYQSLSAPTPNKLFCAVFFWGVDQDLHADRLRGALHHRADCLWQRRSPRIFECVSAPLAAEHGGNGVFHALVGHQLYRFLLEVP